MEPHFQTHNTLTERKDGPSRGSLAAEKFQTRSGSDARALSKPRAQSFGDFGIWISNVPHGEAEISCPDCTRQVSFRPAPWPCPLNREPGLSFASPFSSGRSPMWERPSLVTSFLRLAWSCCLVLEDLAGLR